MGIDLSCTDTCLVHAPGCDGFCDHLDEHRNACLHAEPVTVFVERSDHTTRSWATFPSLTAAGAECNRLDAGGTWPEGANMVCTFHGRKLLFTGDPPCGWEDVT